MEERRHVSEGEHGCERGLAQRPEHLCDIAAERGGVDANRERANDFVVLDLDQGRGALLGRRRAGEREETSRRWAYGEGGSDELVRGARPRR